MVGFLFYLRCKASRMVNIKSEMSVINVLLWWLSYVYLLGTLGVIQLVTVGIGSVKCVQSYIKIHQAVSFRTTFYDVRMRAGKWSGVIETVAKFIWLLSHKMTSCPKVALTLSYILTKLNFRDNLWKHFDQNILDCFLQKC